MPVSNDPFSHHPELRDKITATHESFFRTTSVGSVFATRPELAWVLDLLHSDAVREHSRTQTLAAHGGGDLWVFGYGSLMWDPAFHFSEVRRATVDGYARRFVLKDVWGARGTVDNPGMMAALDRGDCCEGLAFRIARSEIDTETEVLWRREMVGPGYIPTFVTARLDGETVSALTFVADHAAEQIDPALTRAEQIHYIAHGTGFLGTSKEYLANIVRQFAALGIDDAECTELLEAVEAYGAAAQTAGPGVNPKG
ncbi:gamma-glutamylcyclotransferase [Acuticoccus sp. MNP-M23]|uniref:gamma-glutamylcyclotransferase n=1 Tax=Acuticoccus sp. MNP-M23 TaxID=3072793 RepID=UPI00281543E4|nr:gamma-glutamylcyclotransferase [Acuticoccus sp. MNP-M23]WMS41420.1 gamma-glutamylcyclotransferase [Acuticoccus sp. MNP-M23]